VSFKLFLYQKGISSKEKCHQCVCVFILSILVLLFNKYFYISRLQFYRISLTENFFESLENIYNIIFNVENGIVCFEWHHFFHLTICSLHLCDTLSSYYFNFHIPFYNFKYSYYFSSTGPSQYLYEIVP